MNNKKGLFTVRQSVFSLFLYLRLVSQPFRLLRCSDLFIFRRLIFLKNGTKDMSVRNSSVFPYIIASEMFVRTKTAAALIIM